MTHQVQDESLEEGTSYHPSEGKREAVHDAVPDDVRFLIAELDVGKEYSTTLYRVEGTKRTQVEKLLNQYRDPDEIGEMYGPGEYEAVVSWAVPERKTPSTKRFRISIAREYAERHAAYIARRAPATQTESVGTTLEYIRALAGIIPQAPKSDSGLSEILKMQSEMMRMNMDRFEKQADRDREDARRRDEEHRREMRDLLKTISERREPSFLEKVEEIKQLSSVLGIGGPMAPEDNRPVWMQAVEMIGEKAMPLIEAMMSQSKLKRTLATSQLKKAVASDVGQKLLEDQAQQTKFLENLLSRTPVEKRQGIFEMVRALRLDPNVIPEQYRVAG